MDLEVSQGSSIILSVILPNYNHGLFLNERVRSILEALPNQAELILIDDGSTDNSVEIIKRLEGSDMRLKVIYNPYNEGVNHAVNKAISYAKGKYLAFLSANDLILPPFFHAMLKILTKNPEVGLCCCDWGCFFDRYRIRDKPITLSFRLLDTKKSLVYSSKEILALCRDHYFWIPGLAAIVKKGLVEEYGGFNVKLGPKSDWFLLHSIALEKGLAYLPQTLSFWRSSPSSYSRELLDPIKREHWRKQIMDILYKKPALLDKFNRSRLLINRF